MLSNQHENFLSIIIPTTRGLKIVFHSNPQQVISNCRWDSSTKEWSVSLQTQALIFFKPVHHAKGAQYCFAVLKEYILNLVHVFVSPIKLHLFIKVTLSMVVSFSVLWGITFSMENSLVTIKLTGWPLELAIILNAQFSNLDFQSNSCEVALWSMSQDPMND